MTIKQLPAVGYIRECVDYDPSTGIFTWRERPTHHFPNTRAQKWWNTKFAGKAAGRNSSDRNNYWRLCFGHSTFNAHRVAWLLVHGNPVPRMLDHIDGDPLNNRIRNLRAATHAGNIANSKTQTSTTTGVKGVYFRRRGNSARYFAHIGFRGKRYWLGNFATLEEAAAARREAAASLHGEFARHD